VEGVANTFVYTVLLMVITGLTMYLVYGRSSRRGTRTSGKRRGGPAVEVTEAEAASVPDAAPLPAGRP
jgi:iron(III) transport system permease protein